MTPAGGSPALQRLIQQHPRWVAAFLAAVLLAALVFAWRDYTLSHPDRNHAMTALTTSMKTVCFGRYLIDVPANAEVALGNASSDAIPIRRIPAFVSDRAHADHVGQREAQLRAAKHDTEGSLLKSVHTSSDGKHTVLVSRPGASNRRMFLVESFVHAPPVAWHVVDETGEKYLKAGVEAVPKIAQGLSYRPNHVIPTGPGACIADGLLNRAPREEEEFRGGARIEALSWSLSFTSETSGPRDNQLHKDLFHRVDEAIDDAGVGSGIKKLRRAKVQADGRSGQEYVALYPERGLVIFDAKLELYGNATPQQPTIKLMMEAPWPAQRDPKDPRKFLNQDEALALWDAIVKSIRPRPGAF